MRYASAEIDDVSKPYLFPERPLLSSLFGSLFLAFQGPRGYLKDVIKRQNFAPAVWKKPT
jgi:hypothetical protein